MIISIYHKRQYYKAEEKKFEISNHKELGKGEAQALQEPKY